MKQNVYTGVLETLSPVFIGNGSSFSPTMDFIEEEGTIAFLNEKKVIEGMPENVLEEFLSYLKTKRQNDSSSLREFFKRVKIPYESFVSRRVPKKGNVKSTEVKSHLKTKGKFPIVPGSTLKGAFRTALLEAHDIYEREAVRQKSFTGSDVECPFLGFSDTDPGLEEDLCIFVCRRWHVKKENSLPLIFEAIQPGMKYLMKMTFEPERGETVSGKRLFNSIEEIIEAVKTFTKKNVQREVAFMDKHKTEEIQKVTLFYQELIKEMEGLKKNEAIFRIGMGKTFWDNTILKEEDWALYQNTFVKVKPRKDIFPITRTLTFNGSFYEWPLGWVKLTIQPPEELTARIRKRFQERQQQDEERNREKREEEKRQKEEELRRQQEQEMLKKMTDFEKELYLMEKEKQAEEQERLAGELFKKLDSFTDEEQKKAAESLKKVYEQAGKWSGAQSKKQKEKVETIKKILE